MAGSEKVQRLFASLGSSLGFDAMGSNGILTYRLNYDSDLSVHVDYLEDADRIMLAVPILGLQGEGNIDAYVDLLELNLYWDELAGGQFAMLDESKLVLFIRQIDVAAVDEETFVQDVQAFIEVAGTWFDALNGRFADEDTGVDESAQNGFVKV